MSGNDSKRDVIVVGGGVIGLACAWELAGAGAAVTVIEAAEPGQAASRVAAGMLAPIGEHDYGESGLLEMTLASAGLYPDFVERVEAASGRRLDYRRLGALHVGLDRDEAAELKRWYEFQAELEAEMEWLTPARARAFEPGLTTDVTGAVLIPDESLIDPRPLTAALVEALSGAGVECLTSTAVESLAIDGDRVAGVTLAGGERLNAGTVVAATGGGRASMDWLPRGSRPPQRPVKGQIIELRGDPDAPVCEHIVGTERVYVVPRGDGRVMVGATVEERGYDTTVTAGGVHELLREAYRAVPEVAELEFVEAIAGLRPGSPDNMPIIGPAASGIEGLFVATGHYRNGILLAPFTARAIAEMVTGEEPTVPVVAADPARFESGAIEELEAV